MTTDKFIDEIESFQNVYVSEYMTNMEMVIDDDGETGRTLCTDDYGNQWEIPYCVYTQLGHELVGIDIGDAGNLFLDGAGLYCYLWHQAIKYNSPA